MSPTDEVTCLHDLLGDSCDSAIFLMPVVLMFLPSAGTSASETISFNLPENIVLGSERAHISFLGEFLEESWKVIFFFAGQSLLVPLCLL